MKEIKIPISKKKTFLGFLGALGFVLLGFWLFSLEDADLWMKFWAVVDVIFFGFCFLFLLYKLFDQKPGLIINNQGILDQSSAVAAGFIRWDNIVDIAVVEIYGQEILTINVKNKEEILMNQPDLKRKTMSLNAKWFESPVQISTSMLVCDVDELVQIIQEKLEERRR